MYNPETERPRRSRASQKCDELAAPHCCPGSLANVSYRQTSAPEGVKRNAGPWSALGHKPTCALQNLMSALHPIVTAKADIPKNAMSALPPKADVCGANRHVCFGLTGPTT